MLDVSDAIVKHGLKIDILDANTRVVLKMRSFHTP